MAQTPVRIRMLRDADSLPAGSEWDALHNGGGWASVDKTQGVGAARDWRCLMPSEYEVIASEADGAEIRPGAAIRRWWPNYDPVDYEPDGYPYPRPARWIRNSPLNPDMADMADPPDKED